MYCDVWNVVCLEVLSSLVFQLSETGIYEMPNLFLCGFEIGMILVIFHMCSMMLVS